MSTSDEGDMWREIKARRRKLRHKLGNPCPGCVIKFPKATPTTLLPGQKCFCGYTDPRPRREGETGKHRRKRTGAKR